MGKYNKKSTYLAAMTILMIVCCCISFFQLERVTGNIRCIELKYSILNIATLFFCGMIMVIIFLKFWIGFFVADILWTLVALINYYVIKFRGMPITTQDIYNIKTALEVKSAYDFNVSKEIIFIIVMFFVNMVLVLLIRKLEEECKKIRIKKYVYTGMVLFITSIYLYCGYFSMNPIKPKNVLTLSWTEGYEKYGFIACSIEILCKSINPIQKPKGYTINEVENIAQEYKGEQKDYKTPDIILILNETFYDLDLITTTNTNIEIEEPIKKYDNIVKGYSSVQVSGGGTSISEYELLTSNSMHLLHGITPFNSLEFTNANSIVSYLKSMGYYTLGAHPESSVNYSRSRVYPKLGFDEVKFEEDFNDVEYYASRKPENGSMNLITDFSLYQNMISWYNNMPKGPRFCYVLTMQNHSPYNFLNEGEMLVQDSNNYGKYDSAVDEYLSSLYLSYQALGKLIEYYQNIDREVIICMVGDHAPVFASEIADKEGLSNIERDIALCTTPFIIWSNYGLQKKEYEVSSLIYLAPTLISEAGGKLSPYYRYLLNMKEQVPILTQLNHFFNKEHSLITYSSMNEYTELLDKYFWLEYNNIAGREERVQKIFEP